MSARLLLGKSCADEIYAKVQKELRENVTLYAVGFDGMQWKQYTQSLAQSAAKCGIGVSVEYLGEEASFGEFADAVSRACSQLNAAGVLVEQPLPPAFRNACMLVDRRLDVDCVNPLSVAAMYCGEKSLRPATPSAVIKLLDYYSIPIEGKHAVIVGRGYAVGKPLMLMMLERNATVTVCHTKTVNLPAICASADILISACGVAGLIKENFVTGKTVVIDVGLSFVQGKTCGDVSPEVYDKCYAVSPVPGGVGPVTRAVLFENMLQH